MLVIFFISSLFELLMNWSKLNSTAYCCSNWKNFSLALMPVKAKVAQCLTETKKSWSLENVSKKHANKMKVPRKERSFKSPRETSCEIFPYGMRYAKADCSQRSNNEFLD